MRRTVMLLSVVALMVVMLAMSVAPAFAARFPILGPGPVNSCKANIASENAPFCPGLDHLAP
jgi:hypothetical protein